MIDPVWYRRFAVLNCGLCLGVGVAATREGNLSVAFMDLALYTLNLWLYYDNK